MRLALLLYMTAGLLVLAVGHRKWWAETEHLVGISIEKIREDHGQGPHKPGLAAIWMVAVACSLCFDWPLWPRAAWRWWLR